MNGRHPPLARSILDTIGHTPLVELMRSVASRGLTGRLLVKLEYFSPGGSKKDRIALEIIREARASGELKAGQTVVELTSGNTGTGLAIVCRAMGHPFVAVISRGNTVERVRQMEAFIDVFVDMVGTCGSFTGGARALRRLNPGHRAYAVEPAGAAVLGGGPAANPRHRIQGAGYARTDLALLERSLAAGYVSVTRRASHRGGPLPGGRGGHLRAGFSTGAHLAAAWKLLAAREAGATIAFVACDSGLKYLSTDLFP